MPPIYPFSNTLNSEERNQTNVINSKEKRKMASRQAKEERAEAAARIAASDPWDVNRD